FAGWRPHVAGVAIAAGLAAVAGGMFGGAGALVALELLGLGTLVLFAGVALVSSYLVGPIVRLVGRPARGLGGTAGRLASAHPAPSRRDGGRADDRPRAGHLRRDARVRPPLLDRRCARQAGEGRLRRLAELERVDVLRVGRRQLAGACAGGDRLWHPQRPRPR